MPLGLRLYKVLTTLIAPFMGAIFRRRAKDGKEDFHRIDERFTRNPSARPEGRLIWLHAASVGESQLLLELTRRLASQLSAETHLLFSCQTQTAAKLIGAALADPEPGIFQRATHVMAPIDTPKAARHFLDHWQPDMAIFAEGEIWPNLLTGLQKRGVPMALINARMTEKSILGWMRWPKTAQALFGGFHTLIAADLQTKTGLEALSKQTVLHPGNLKSALPPPGVDAAALAALRETIGDRPVFLAASTHPSEEALALDAFMQMQPRPFFILAPRHPERGDDIAGLLSCTDFKTARRSAEEPITQDTDILLADTMGEMGLWYRLADTVYLGGGHAAGVGGHNPIEALRLNRPVLTGPSLFNFKDLSERLVSHQGFTIVEDADAIAANFPAPAVSQDLTDLLESDAVGPMSATIAALEPLLREAKLVS